MQKDETTAQLQAAGQDQDPAPKIDFNGISVLNNNISIQDEEEQRDSLVDSLLSIEAKMPENDPEDKNVNPPNPIQETGSSITFQKQELGPGVSQKNSLYPTPFSVRIVAQMLIFA